MRLSAPLLAVFLVPFSLTLGCAYGELRQVLRTEVASEIDCPEIDVTKKGLAYFDADEATDSFKVTGCGVVRTYTCPAAEGLVKYGHAPCTFVEGDPDQPQMTPAAQPAGGADPFDDESAGGLDDEESADDDSDGDSDEDSDEGI